MQRHLARSLLLAGSLISACNDAANATPLPLKLVADAPLSGHTTRWDYASLDPVRHRLYLAHLGDGMVTVFDTEHNRIVADIPGVDAVHGVLVVPELNRVYATATGTNEVVAIDADSLKILARMPGGVYPDGMTYAPEVHKLYVSDEHGGTETVIDAQTNRRLATIELGGEAGNAQYDPVSRHVFVNEQRHGQLIEIDPASDMITARIALPGAESNHGLYIDAADRLAFIACEDNDRLLVLDLASHKVSASFELGREPDVLAFDPATRLLYVASESGNVSMFRLRDGKLEPRGSGVLGNNAHVVAVDSATQRSYFPLKNERGRSVLRIMAPLLP